MQNARRNAALMKELFSTVLHAMEHVLQAASVLQRVEPQVATAPQGKGKIVLYINISITNVAPKITEIPHHSTGLYSCLVHEPFITNTPF